MKSNHKILPNHLTALATMRRRKREKQVFPVDGLTLTQRESKEVECLKSRIESETPEKSSQYGTFEAFEALPLSKYTLEALREAKFTKPTKVQAAAIPHALAGRDILGAAKTGSGKTLAFLVPLLERLYRNRWSKEDGLGGLVISPTRELALQIFEVLRSIGKKHRFSAGLVLGGKNFQEEIARVSKMNIIICTPGRILQHLESTSEFYVDNLEMLVLDEADRILDLGFEEQLTSILTYLPGPGVRQTLLFSATQTKSIKDLARLNLSNPEYIAVHDQDEHATPQHLSQKYILCPLEQKIDALFTFIKTHLKHKSIVFLSSCAQVRFLYQVFCKMQPGIPLLSLHGKVKQAKRIGVYYDFLNKPAAVLFATDIAARGLDFPAVDWVIQVDCPEDTDAYIHRVGRTARNNQKGHGLIFLLPTEEKGMIQQLLKSKIPLSKMETNPNKTIATHRKIASIVAADKDLKQLAQKAFMSYVRSTHLQPNKDIFQLKQISFEEYAHSLGLAGAPRLVFLNQESDRNTLRQKKNVNKKLQALKDKIKAKQHLKRKITNDQNENDQNAADDTDTAADDIDTAGGLLVLKKTNNTDEDETMETEMLEKKKNIKKIRIGQENSTKLVFDDNGIPRKPFDLLTQSTSHRNQFTTLQQQSDEFSLKVLARLQEQDQEDRQREKLRVREKHIKRRLNGRKEQEEPQSYVTLANEHNEQNHENDEDAYSSSGDSYSSSDDPDDEENASSSNSRGYNHRNDDYNNSSSNDQEQDTDFKPTSSTIQQQEERVLEMLQRKRKA